MPDRPAPSEIDFLPVQFRERKVKRQTNAWRVGVIVLMGGGIAAALACQVGLRYEAQCELKDLEPRYKRAQDQTQHLTDLQRQLAAMNDRANLYAYLRHPWPRTQICAAVVNGLPTEITLQELRIWRETPTTNNAATVDKSRPKSKTDEAAELAKLSPAARDLRRLRDEWDKQQTVVSLSGTASDEDALRNYLKRLAENDFFSKVDWGPVEKSEADANHSEKFTVRLIVRAGYGQPGGPQGAPRTAAASTNPESQMVATEAIAGGAP